MDSLPIGDYALLSDCRTAALVSRVGSVDWLCCPRFDAPAVFARLLDPDGGHFAIRPGDFQASRAYVDQTMALETTFRTKAGTAVLTDAMAVGRNDRGHHLGAASPESAAPTHVHRRGNDVDVSYAPRPEYGLIYPILQAVPGGIAARGGASRLLLSAPAGFQVPEDTSPSPLLLVPGTPSASRSSTDSCRSRRWPPGEAGQSPPACRTPWKDGAPGPLCTRPIRVPGATWCSIPAGSCRRHVRPDRGLVAAPTTSLPEAVGGGRTGNTAIPGCATPA